MELQFAFNFTNFLLLLSFIFFLHKGWKKFSTRPRKLPPGPWKLPLIGHLHHIGTLPHRSFQELAKKYGPLMHFKLGEVTAVVVSSPALSKEVLKVHDPTFADRPENIAGEILWYNSSNISFSQYGDYWRQMRKICILELLSAKNVKSFGSIRNDEVSHLVDSIGASSGAPVDLTEKIFMLTSSITCRAAFGKVCRDKDQLIEMFKEGITLVSGFDVSDLYPSSKILRAISCNRRKLLRMRRKLDLILDDIIGEHRRNLAKIAADKDSSERRGNGEFGNEDLVDVLLRVQQSGELEFPITDDNIKAVIYDIFAAGTETSSTTVDWIMAELIRNPRVMAKVQNEIRQTFKGNKTIEEADVQNLKYLKLVIKEGLRLHAPIPLIPRVSRQDTEIAGYLIPARAKVLVNAWGMGRDPEIWPNPESFEPERFDNISTDFTGNHFEYIPFGAGRRMCPGMTFGLASVELPLAHLLYNFDWKLPDGMSPVDLDMVERPAITAARRQNLELVATRYHGLPK
ncbi:UNVERIFIED_CONTAM: Premnaspirodiene oxygenase [Sesamum latifolium]|uniref:Premnaspirodiene oxygenase n=1 Tax=Sesamum latifolium TaxID=2727402 RepID=A0AAW2SP85_9LAMI